MHTIKILHMYPDILDLYGDGGNIEILRYRCAMRGIGISVDRCSIGEKIKNFSEYDLIYLGGGADIEQKIISKELLKYKKKIMNAYKNGTFLLMICGGYQLMGQYYKDSNGIKIPGLGLFDYYTVASTDKSLRCIGNIIIESEIGGETTRVIGFENHGGMTHNVASPFGKVIYGSGNFAGGTHEGYFEKNVIATYLHGPLLSKNPKVADYIISYCVNRNEITEIELPALDDTIENKCRDSLFERFLH
jgi:hypothetical protein